MFGAINSSLRSSEDRNFKSSVVGDGKDGAPWSNAHAAAINVPIFLHSELAIQEKDLERTWILPPIALLPHQQSHNSSSNTSNLSQFSFSSPMPSSPTFHGGGGEARRTMMTRTTTVVTATRTMTSTTMLPSASSSDEDEYYEEEEEDDIIPSPPDLRQRFA